ncbi:hypothetical protein PsorP6_012351 [Peronosclerospora sorghi]|uniref:Uncharacterized protein n=1 Tax=Peronosclerospora sorghi TaxID=230839 RepID=A0ACC0WI27_9STRA|nr:hypothetical protein PsorP6_012351 [Peronosclerospora sorghi]
MTPGRLALYKQMFDLPAHRFGDQYITHDDLEFGREQTDDDPNVLAAKEELRAFFAAIKSDLRALRSIWRAAELQAHVGDYGTNSITSRSRRWSLSTFKSSWFYEVRENPIGSDWG